MYGEHKCMTFVLSMRVLRMEKRPSKKNDTPSDLRWTMDNGHKGEGRSTSPLCHTPESPSPEDPDKERVDGAERPSTL